MGNRWRTDRYAQALLNEPRLTVDELEAMTIGIEYAWKVVPHRNDLRLIAYYASETYIMMDN